MPAFDPTRQVHGGTRTLPAPFQRPSIDLDRNITRRWRHVYAYQVMVGDIVQDFGVVSWTSFTGKHRTESLKVVFHNDVSGGRLVVEDLGVLHAFTNAHPDSYPTPEEIRGFPNV